MHIPILPLPYLPQQSIMVPTVLTYIMGLFPAPSLLLPHQAAPQRGSWPCLFPVPMSSFSLFSILLFYPLTKHQPHLDKPAHHPRTPTILFVSLPLLDPQNYLSIHPSEFKAVSGQFIKTSPTFSWT